MQDPETIRRWVSEAEAEVAQLTDEAERVARQLAEARRRLGLLHEALAAVSKDPAVLKTTVEPLSIRERVIRDTRSILEYAGHPLSISAIHAEFIRCGYPVPGRGSPTNLVAHIGATDRIARLSRGVYVLPEWRTHGLSATEPEMTPAEETTP
jgi:hypothetical protein